MHKSKKYFNYITLAEPKLPVADDSLVVVSIAPKSQTKWAKWASATGGRTICGSIWFAWALGGQVARWPGGQVARWWWWSALARS